MQGLTAVIWMMLALQQAPAPARITVRVLPDTVTIGQPFVLTVRVAVPGATAIAFPPGPDSTSATRLLDPVTVSSARDSAGVFSQTATYRMAAWDVDRQLIALGSIAIETPEGVQRLSLGTQSVQVQSVLPADSAQRIPKPAREFYPGQLPWWYPWVPLALLALALAAIFKWWWQRRRVSVVMPRGLEIAEREFLRIDAMHLVEAGEGGRFVALTAEVLRDFLARRFDGVTSAQTTGEILKALDQIEPAIHARVAQLLADGDGAKFARGQIGAAAATRLGRDVQQLVRDIGDPLPLPPPLPDEEEQAA